MWLLEKNIRIIASLRAKKRQRDRDYQKLKRRKEATERNHIEGKFGQEENGYNLNEIRARLKNTSESWAACIFL